tara:strand:- start:250 stop:414 length:165 start_codon:yes stop_codon:yes gene_type:complete
MIIKFVNIKFQVPNDKRLLKKPNRDGHCSSWPFSLADFNGAFFVSFPPFDPLLE